MSKFIVIIVFSLITIWITGYRDSSISNQSTAAEFENTYNVLNVVDGDTITIETEDGEQSIRLIGIDTPEVDPNKGGPECYGLEAKMRTKSLVEENIKIETDPSQGMRDKYDRLLAYIRLADGSLLNETLIKEGYAREYTYNKPYRYQGEFKISQTQARRENRGLWSACE